ncbi:MAG: hypothetical protein ACR2FY_17060 [Pirellulaceae bacterium]
MTLQEDSLNELEDETARALKLASDAALPFQSGQSTSKKAAEILVAKDCGFFIPTAKQRQNLLVAFAKKGKVLYGKAFDVVKTTHAVDLDDLESVERNLASIVIAEIKATKKNLPHDFAGFFFALTAGEVLVAQSLKDQFRFVFVNTATKGFLELRLTEIFSRAKGIYPTWSVSF